MSFQKFRSEFRENQRYAYFIGPLFCCYGSTDVNKTRCFEKLILYAASGQSFMKNKVCIPEIQPFKLGKVVA